MTFTKSLLSGSTNGRPIKVSAASTPGTIVHTATSSPGDFDEVWLWVNNTGESTVQLTVEWGGVSSPGDLIVVSIPIKKGLVLVAPGLPVSGGVVVRAFADSSDAINVVGYVNRISA